MKLYFWDVYPMVGVVWVWYGVDAHIIILAVVITVIVGLTALLSFIYRDPPQLKLINNNHKNLKCYLWVIAVWDTVKTKQNNNWIVCLW